MSGWFELLGWPPSILHGGLIILAALAYGTQAKTRLRPLLLAIQASLISLVLISLAESFTSQLVWPLEATHTLLSQTFGRFVGTMIIGWLIIHICFIIRLRNTQGNIFTRNRRS